MGLNELEQSSGSWMLIYMPYTVPVFKGSFPETPIFLETFCFHFTLNVLNSGLFVCVISYHRLCRT